MSTLSRSLAFFLADVTLRATAVLVITAITAVLSRRASASFRHQVWTLGLIGALCLPVLTSVLPGWRIPIRSAARMPTVAMQPTLAVHLRHGAASPALAPTAVTNSLPETRTAKRPAARALSPQPVPTAAAAAEPRFSLAEWGLLAWVVGAIFVLAQLAQGLVGLRRIGHKSVPITDAWCANLVSESSAALRMERLVTVRRMSAAGRVRVPLTYGALAPVIVLPAGGERWPAERLRAAFLHELAHVRRRDWPLQIVVHIALSLYWFHPLVWFAVRHARAESENSCDDLVLATGMPAQEYARQLLDVALCAHFRLPFMRDPVAGVVTMAQTPKVEGRLRRILAERRCRREVTGVLRGVIWGIGAGVLVVAAMARPVVRAGGETLIQPAGVRSGGPVVGRVVTPAGDPAPNVAVFWVERGEDMVTRRRFVTDTDSHGQFRFPEAPPNIGEDRAVVLLAQAPGWGLSPQSLPTDLPAAALLTLVLQPPTTLHVSFVDEAGKPLSNIHPRVRALYDRQRGFLDIPADMHGRWEQKTDAQGACVFPGLPQGARAYFAIEEPFADPDFSESVSLGKSTTQQAGPIRLFPGAVAQGRVTLPNGNPAAGIRVGAQEVAVGGGGGEAITDARGGYRLTHLRSGVYNIAVFLHGEWERTRTAVALEKAVVSPGAPLRHDFVLTVGAQITGRVTDRSTGRPIPGVQIGIYGPAHPRSGAAVQVAARTGIDGVYLARVPAGEQYVYMYGAPNNYERLPGLGGVDVTLQEGETHSQDFVLTPSTMQDLKPIRVHVVGPDGKAVGNATVHVLPMTKYMDAGSIRDVETDRDGVCVVQMSAASSPALTASALLRASSGALATEKATLAQSGEYVTLQLNSGVMLTLSGQVLDEKDRPLLNAKVTLIEWQLDSGMSTRTAKTDARGRYSFADLFPDPRYSVSAQAEGFGTAGTNPVEHQLGEKIDLGALRLPRASSVVDGCVVDENGDPVAKQTLMLQGMATAPREVVADEHGRFHVEGVVNEDLVLYLNNGAGYDANSKRVHAGDTGVILVRRSAHPAAAAANAQDDAATKQRAALLQHTGPALKAAVWLNTAARMPDALKGKIVLIDFWATSCGPCVGSLPAVQKLSEQLAGKNVVVIGLHASGIEPEELRSFIKAHKVTYPIAIDSADGQHAGFGQTMSSYGVLGIPTVAVLDRNGVVRYLDFGLDGATAAIGQILASEK